MVSGDKAPVRLLKWQFERNIRTGGRMASIFLSYAREDLGAAKALASSLERCGHSVWWDRHIKGGTLAATALKGAWELFAARKGTAEKFKEAKSTAVWAGGLSLLSWFALSLMVGAGLYQWGTDNGAAALSKSFALGTTSALTILFVWGTKH